MKSWWMVAGLLLVGCSGASEGPDGGEEASGVEEYGEGATITFTASHEQKVTGALLSGGQVKIVYDPARLTGCRGTKYGMPAWAITGHYRIGDGPAATFTAAQPQTDGAIVNTATLELPAAGELQVWFQNTSAFGCQAWDSAYGQNYRFTVKLPASAPGWVGNEAVVIARETCDGAACDADRRPLSELFRFDTWARERAAIAGVYFEVWKEGVTDVQNPDLWKKLDVQMYYRHAGQTPFARRPVNFDRYAGHNARYAVPLRELDPLGRKYAITSPSDCPAGALVVSEDKQYVSLDVEYYFRINGVELRPAAGQTYRGRFENHRDLYDVCLSF